MPVRGEGLRYVLSALIIWYTPTLLGQIIMIAVLLLWYIRYHHHSTIWYVLFLIFACWWIQEDIVVNPTSQIIQVKEIASNYVIGSDHTQRYILYGLEEVGIDDVVLVKGTDQPIHSLQNFYGFSFEKWCKRRNIVTQIQVQEKTILQEGNSIRHQIYERIQSFDEQSKEFVSAFIFGITDQKEKFVSFMKAAGFHISAFFLFLRNICNKMHLKHSRIIAFVIGFLFVSIGRESAAINRVLVFEFVACLPIDHDKDRFAFGVLLCVLLFPYQLYEYGFLLSCAIRMLGLFYLEKRYFRYFINLILIPFQLMTFYKCDLMQVVLFSWYRKLFFFGYLYAWLLVLFPFLDGGVAWIFMLLQGLVHFTADQLVLTGKPYWIWVIIWAKGGYHLMHELKWRYVLQLLGLLWILPFQSYLNPFGEVMMIDVGQGDCFLIQLPFHQGTMMIDVAGSLYKNIPETVIAPILKAKGIRSIDVLVVSHDDYDHSGGLNELSDLVSIDQVITDYQPEIALGPARFSILQAMDITDDRNDQSLIVYGTLGRHDYLFMGDAGVRVEEYLLSNYPLLTCDVLKLGHHGSNTSSSAAFLQQVSPQLALISAGKNNRYHHPSDEVIKRLNDYQIAYQNSAETGAVSIYVTPWFSFFVNASHEFGFLK